jgi:hypothetical protein
MYIPFDEIAFEARLWIYQADRPLTDDEVGTLNELLRAAVDGWKAHERPLTASFKLFYNRFIVLAVDEKRMAPSGCSIDASVHWLQEIGQRMSVGFFDRSVAYLDEKGGIQTLPVREVKQAIVEERIEPSTLVFDHLVPNKVQWMKRWKVPADQTWMKRFFEEQQA